MHSNSNSKNNNNNYQQKADSRQQTDMSDNNGLHYVFNGLKLLNKKRNSPPFPTKKPHHSLETPLHFSCEASTHSQRVNDDSVPYCAYSLLDEDNADNCPYVKYPRSRVQAFMMAHRRNNPPELIHHNTNINMVDLHRYSNTTGNNNNNNTSYNISNNKIQEYHPHQPEGLTSVKVQEKDLSKQEKKSSNVIRQTGSGTSARYPHNHSTSQHYRHYYSYYYNRRFESPEKFAPTSPTSPTENCAVKSRTSRKLPTHRMAANKGNDLFFDESQRYEHAANNSSVAVSQLVSYNINKYNNESREVHVLREKVSNNNIIPNLFENERAGDSAADNDDDEDDWFLELNRPDRGGGFKDLKNNVYDARFQRLFNAKCKMRMPAGDDAARKMEIRPFYDPTENAKKNLGVPIANESDTALPENVKKDASSPHKKRNEDGAAAKLMQRKIASPPVPRVLLYNNQSPRSRLSNRHLPRLSPSSLRVRDFRRMRTKSSSYCADDEGGGTSVTSKPKQLGSSDASEHNKNNNSDDYANDARPPANKAQTNELQFKQKDGGKVKNEDGENNNQPEIKNHDDVDSVDDFDNVDLDDVSNFGDSADSDISSDSENGYRSHAYKATHAAATDRNSSSDNASSFLSPSSDECLRNPECLLVPSLFPNVPPYLSFSSNTTKGPAVPPELYRILKWRVTNVMPKVVRCVLANSGVRLLKKTNDWMGIWGKHLKSPCFKTIRPYQKINHLPGSFKIGRKDSCWKNLQRQMLKHGRRDFGFMPRTYIIPNDLNILRKSWPKYTQRNVKWIIKPPASARGTGIRVVDRWAQIPKRRPLIVQKYIERPFLINGSKFDLRLYVLVTSINPLRVFLYHNGLARFASVKYSDKSDTLNDRCMHLTNYSINKFSSNYSKNEDVNACHGHKWTIKSLWTYLANRGVRTDLLWEALRSLVLRTILAGENSINNMIKMNVESKYSVFELFGFDVLLDADLVPWLLEVNISPSLHSELPLDAHVKAPLVQSVLNTAMYHVPPKLSMERQREIAEKLSLPPAPICFDKRLYINYLSRVEKVKHNTFTRKAMEDRDEYIKAILEDLTPDDVRCLVIAEDELARSAPLERIFPTNQTYKYLKYTDTPRYYNRLLDAWENRYAHNRSEGIALLREYCEFKCHLDVPPAPVKKYFEDDDTAYFLPPEPEDLPRNAATNIQASNVNAEPSTKTNTSPNDCTEVVQPTEESTVSQ